MTREGLKFIFPAVAGGVGFLLSPLKVFAIPFITATVFFLFFFRDPERRIPDEDGIILSPADGKVVFAGEDESEFGRRKRVGIFMRIYDVHVNRIPFSGKVKEILHIPGRFSIASRPQAHLENERNIMRIETEKGDYILMQVAGKVARRIVCRVKEGDEVKRGAKFGMIMFGSRVEVFLPPSAEILVNIGDKVKAGETIIGRMF